MLLCHHRCSTAAGEGALDTLIEHGAVDGDTEMPQRSLWRVLHSPVCDFIVFHMGRGWRTGAKQLPG